MQVVEGVEARQVERVWVAGVGNGEAVAHNCWSSETIFLEARGAGTDLLRFLSVNASGCTEILFAHMRCMKCDRVLVNSARQSHPRNAHCLSSSEQECNYCEHD